MGKKMSYDLNPRQTLDEGARFDTCTRFSGGFNLDLTNLNVPYLPSLAPIRIDFKERKAYAVRNVVVVEAYSSASTSIKVKKGSLVYVGMFIGNGSKGAKVAGIDSTNADYDTLTLEAGLGADVKKDVVLFEASAVGGTTPKNVANSLNYGLVKVETGATVTGIISIYEIRSTKLPMPISDTDKKNLGDRFQFND